MGGAFSTGVGTALSALQVVQVQVPVLRVQLKLLANSRRLLLCPPPELKLTKQSFSVTFSISPQIQFSREWTERKPELEASTSEAIGPSTDPTATPSR